MGQGPKTLDAEDPDELDAAGGRQVLSKWRKVSFDLLGEPIPGTDLAWFEDPSRGMPGAGSSAETESSKPDTSCVAGDLSELKMLFELMQKSIKILILLSKEALRSRDLEAASDLGSLFSRGNAISGGATRELSSGGLELLIETSNEGLDFISLSHKSLSLGCRCMLLGNELLLNMRLMGLSCLLEGCGFRLLHEGGLLLDEGSVGGDSIVVGLNLHCDEVVFFYFYLFSD